MNYRVVIEKVEPKGTSIVFDGELAGEGVGQVARIADSIRGGFAAGLGSKVRVKSITWASGDHVKVDDKKVDDK